MNRAQLIEELQRIVGRSGVVDDYHALMTYNADGCMMDTHAPDVVVVPRSSEQVVEIVKLANRANIPVTARGAGTGLSGGATPLQGGIVVSFARMDQVLEIDAPDHRAIVEPGIINFELSEYLKPQGYHFAPDPSSQKTCTLGGNIANNSGGPHCLKYGVTSNHILALELILHDGTLLWTSDGLPDAAGYDLTGLVVGSEGTFGLATRIMVRLTALPEANRVVLALFPTIASASQVVSAVVAAGYLPTSLEMMDNVIIRAVNKGYNLGLPESAGAALLIEIDGVEDGLDDLLQEISAICTEHGAIELRPARTVAEQTKVWSARKNAFGAVGRLAPAYYLADTVVPRTRLPYMMEEVARLSEQYELEIANVFHAGDGNLHPIVLYDPRNEEQVKRALTITSTVIKLSIEQGGVISGEHGIGIEKRDYMAYFFDTATLHAMAAVYAVFNPNERLNPAKIFPADTRPLELAQQRMQRITSSHATMDAGDLPNQLQHIVGADYVLQNEAATPYTVQQHAPQLVVMPASTQELSAVMAACHQAGATVVPWGGGTKQEHGTLSTRPDVVLVTRRLNEVVKYEPADLTIGIGAGATLHELRTILAEHNQMFPLDVPLPERATLGGMVATAAEGPRRLVYGIMRDLLLGMTIVEVDGTIIKAGGQVVKNVSGYDLVKLFQGSYGTLGIIASVQLKTLPRPRAEATFLSTFTRPEDAMAMVADLSQTRLTPTAIEYFNALALQRLGMVGACALAIRAEGLAVACQRHMHDLETLATRHYVLETRQLFNDDHTTLWQQVNDFAAITQRKAEETCLRLIVPASAVATALKHLEERAVAHGLTCASTARAFSGVIFAHINGPQAGMRSLQQELVERWQHSHILACPPAWKDDLPLWGAPPAGHFLMQALKQTFDPANTLNPGRYVV
jgi:D-lactate dehydrogenase (cytochrome)